ncbi:MAG: phage virion morphogenesis protein [Bacteroidetes bacterium QH_9_67_14]|nr:MAG: phage virion morphogenesis protein [Bacteroidetes bacterium QH_9_67_14]
MATVAETIQSGVEDNFRREVGPGAKPWADLAEETKEERAREGKWPGPILQRSGQLVAAIQPFSSPSEAGVSVQKTYAAIHQYGGTGDIPPGPAGIPPRPYLYLVYLRVGGVIHKEYVGQFDEDGLSPRERSHPVFGRRRAVEPRSISAWAEVIRETAGEVPTAGGLSPRGRKSSLRLFFARSIQIRFERWRPLVHKRLTCQHHTPDRKLQPGATCRLERPDRRATS